MKLNQLWKAFMTQQNQDQEDNYLNNLFHFQDIKKL